MPDSLSTTAAHVSRLRRAADTLDTAAARRCGCPDCLTGITTAISLRRIADDHDAGCLPCRVRSQPCPDLTDALAIAEHQLEL